MPKRTRVLRLVLAVVMIGFGLLVVPPDKVVLGGAFILLGYLIYKGEGSDQ